MLHVSKDISTEKVRELWGKTEAGAWRTGNILHWLEHPAVQKRNNRLVSGFSDIHRFQYFAERFFSKKGADRALTLGCGHGELERGFLGFFKRHDAVDIAEGAIEQATKQARDSGLKHIHYSVADLNAIRLPRCTYDVVFGISSIHHVSNLEHLFTEVGLALKPGGYFFLDEFVGPNKFQWTDAQLAAINEQLGMLPPDLKISLYDGTPKVSVRRLNIEEMDAVDPSEAVRSEDILKLLPLYFDILEVKGIGGTILHMLLEGIAGNFAENDARAVSYLEAIFQTEDQLITNGTLQHDFAVIIARRKPTRVERVFGRQVAYFVSKSRSNR
jgi:SAM-dependent methyltransferase